MRTVALALAGLLGVMNIACGATQVTVRPIPPTARPTFAAGAGTAGPFGNAAVETVECPMATAESTEPVPYLAEAPEPPLIPGAGQPDEEELNEGEDPPTPPDPRAVIEPDRDLEQPVFVPPGAQGDPLPEDVVTYRPATNIPGASQIAEPNVAVNGETMLMTWNWGAARSFDGGGSVQYMDPYRVMRGPDGSIVDGGFCCDELAHHVPSHNLWLWVLQSMALNRDSSGGNRIRVAIAKGDGPFDRYWDFRSQDGGLPIEVWYDQPKVGTSNGYLFLSINAYGIGAEPQPFIASVVYRVSLDDLAAGADADPDCFTTWNLTNRAGSTLFAPVPVRIARDVMYLAAHYSNSELAVWRWPDGSPGPSIHLALDLSADDRPAGYPLTAGRFQCPSERAPSSADWCQGSNDRISTAWLANGRIGFAWNVAQDPDNGWNYPSIWVRMIDEVQVTTCAQGGCVVARPNIRHRDTAHQYAAVASNSRGDLGVAVLYGGGRYRPSCWYAIRDADAADQESWDWSEDAFASNRDALRPAYGHYLNIWPGPNEASWTAACMTIQTTNAADKPATSHFFQFGRRADQPIQ